MKFERTKSMTYYCCPICEENSTNRAKIEMHFREAHQVRVNKFIRCGICGEGWSVRRFGEETAQRLAEQCCQSHIDVGNADQIATQSYFASHGCVGYVKSMEGEESVENNHIKKIEVADE
jgi:hypothetical protein|nr:MAG TPA: zinc finger and BTB domain-containing protein [Bacteriophage sp.]